MNGNYVQVAVECPVCLKVPRRVPIPMCPAGHLVCRRCRRHVMGKCPTCRRKLRRGEVNSVAAFLIDKIPHKCKYDSCQERDNLANILEHEKTCTRRAQDRQNQDEDESDEDEVEDEQEEDDEGEEEDVRVMIVPNRAEAVPNRFQEFAAAILLFMLMLLFLPYCVMMYKLCIYMNRLL